MPTIAKRTDFQLKKLAIRSICDSLLDLGRFQEAEDFRRDMFKPAAREYHKRVLALAMMESFMEFLE